MRYTNSSSGFAMGMILLVIALMATVTVAMSYGFRGGGNDLTIEKANAYAAALKSQGMSIRNVIRTQMTAETYALANRDPACDPASNRNCLVSALQFRKIPDEAFTSTIASANLYSLWAYNTRFQFQDSGTNFNLDIYVHRQPIQQNICLLIESRNRGQRITASDIPVAFQLSFLSLPTVNGYAVWKPVAVDGCFGDGIGYYYYVVVGKGT